MTMLISKVSIKKFDDDDDAKVNKTQQGYKRWIAGSRSQGAPLRVVDSGSFISEQSEI